MQAQPTISQPIPGQVPQYMQQVPQPIPGQVPQPIPGQVPQPIPQQVPQQVPQYMQQVPQYMQQPEPKKSKTNLIIAVVVLVIVVLVFAFIFMSSGNANNSNANRSRCVALGGTYDMLTGTCRPQRVSPAPVEPSPEENCTALGGVYDSATGNCSPRQVNGNGPADPQQTCNDLGGFYDTSTGVCSPVAPLAGPDVDYSALNCEQGGGIWNSVTNTCESRLTVSQRCSNAGKIYDSASGLCLTELQLQSQCRANGNIWDEETSTCITETQARTRCESSSTGAHWHSSTGRCVVCNERQVYFPESGSCAQIGSSVGDDLIAASDACIQAGNFWDANADQCYLKDDLRARCNAQGMIIKPTGNGRECATCESIDPASSYNPDTHRCEIFVDPALSAAEQQCVEANAQYPGQYGVINDECVHLEQYRQENLYRLLDACMGQPNPPGYAFFMDTAQCYYCPGWNDQNVYDSQAVSPIQDLSQCQLVPLT